MELNFNLSAAPAVSSSLPRLKPYQIHRVKLADIKVEQIKGKKDPDAVYDILKIRFENNEGYYEESVFFPKEGDNKRPTRQNKEGHEVEMPSSFERTMSLIAQVGTVLNPKEFEKMKGIPFKSFGELCDGFIRIMKPVFGTETNLKLIGKTDKQGNFGPCLPYFLSLNKQGEVWVSDNFIGENLFFSDYDIAQQKKISAKRPTDVEAAAKTDAAAEASTDTSSVDEIDFNSLK